MSGEVFYIANDSIFWVLERVDKKWNEQACITRSTTTPAAVAMIKTIDCIFQRAELIYDDDPFYRWRLN